MPLYEYDCPQHGVFEATRGLSEYAQPAPCPACAVACARILSLPRVAAMERSQVIARDRNERSAHEPRVARKSAVGESAHHHGRGSCHHGANQGAAKGNKLRAYKGARPWVIEHG